MRQVTPRHLTYVALIALAAAAVRISPPAPPARKPAELLAETRRPTERTRVDTLGRGESLAGLLSRGGLSDAEVIAALGAADDLDARRLAAGMRVSVKEIDSIPSEIVLHRSIDKSYHLRRTDSGWVAEEVVVPWTVDTAVARGVITSSLYNALELTGRDTLPQDARAALTFDLADVYEYRVDMSRDLRVNDSVMVLFERKTHPSGATRIGKILASTFSLSGQVTEAVRFENNGSVDYYDQDGKSMRAAFLRAPLQFRRISSVFGMRRHPILGIRRAHQGTDYAASSGTPVRAVGDGTVIFAGRRGGYGNVLEIRHRNGFVSRYAHLKAFARGVSRGARVTIAQTVAYVGTTGLSTAPHLHFEVLVNGVHRDPRTALANRAGLPLPASQRAAFDSVRARRLLSFGVLPPVSLAQRQ